MRVGGDVRQLFLGADQYTGRFFGRSGPLIARVRNVTSVKVQKGAGDLEDRELLKVGDRTLNFCSLKFLSFLLLEGHRSALLGWDEEEHRAKCEDAHTVSRVSWSVTAECERAMVTDRSNTPKYNNWIAVALNFPNIRPTKNRGFARCSCEKCNQEQDFL
ncbi:hypothetical protein SLA2020_261570 [Shorea laevis]